MLLSILAHVTVIVPLAPGETDWVHLAQDLAALPPGAEVLLVGPEAPRGQLEGRGARLSGGDHRLAWVRSPRGRARQLNAGAKAAQGRFLWFLHADTRFGLGALAALAQALEAAPAALHYFDLGFAGDGPALLRLNEAGVWLRSRLLQMPFGDQGFCLERQRFAALGGYDEAAPYGEDHLLGWAARRAHMPLRPTGARLMTSARKYQERGWLPLTASRVYLTCRQAWPEFVKTYRPGRS